jgi:hypothetical protein
MTDLIFLEKYGGESLEELIAMDKTHRVDSLVLAMEEALNQKAEKIGMGKLTPEERIILAVEALEREVNNDGYHQFFLNSSSVFAGEIEFALSAIGCPKHAAIARRAVNMLKIKGELTEEAIEHASSFPLVSQDPFRLHQVGIRGNHLFQRGGLSAWLNALKLLSQANKA